MELSCETLRTTHQAREAVRTGQAARPCSYGNCGGAVLRMRGRATRRRRGCCYGDRNGSAGKGKRWAWRPRSSSPGRRSDFCLRVGASHRPSFSLPFPWQEGVAPCPALSSADGPHRLRLSSALVRCVVMGRRKYSKNIAKVRIHSSLSSRQTGPPSHRPVELQETQKFAKFLNLFFCFHLLVRFKWNKTGVRTAEIPPQKRVRCSVCIQK